MLARGNTLAAALGFDRSGLGTAVVRGKGMPLRDSPKGRAAVRGNLVVKFPICAIQYTVILLEMLLDMILSLLIVPLCTTCFQFCGGKLGCLFSFSTVS